MRTSHKISTLILAFLAILVFASGCSGPAIQGLELVKSTVRRDRDHYVVTAILRNGANEKLELDRISIEMTTFNYDGDVLASGYPFAFEGMVPPASTTRLPLHRPDPRNEIHRSRITLKDVRGRILSELDVP